MTPATLHIDFETRSTVDLRKTGVHVYAEDPSTELLCAAYAVDDGDVQIWTGGACPNEIIEAVEDNWTIVAHNAQFERIIWKEVCTKNRDLWPEPKLEQWRCTMAMALALSLPASLGNASAAVGLDQGKDMGGRDLMLRMSKPRRPRKGEAPGGLYWYEDAERLQSLYNYCKQDVVVERELDKRLLALRPSEQALWQLDQRINDRGVFVDTALCEAALKVVESATDALNEEINRLTEGAVSATTNVAQIAKWMREAGFKTTSLDKEAIDDFLVRVDLPPVVRRVLEIRREAAKAAVKKIDALVSGRSKNGRAKGLLQFHAAGTGRWAGRRFQPQNIKRPELDDVDGAIEAVSTASADYVRVLYGEPLAVVGDCLRGMVRAAPGNHLYAADFSNIEGRIQAWLGDEHWKLDAFRAYDAGTGHDLYKIAYARAFGIKPEDVDKLMRQIGKVMEVALGYQGGVGAFQKMAVNYKVVVSDERADELKMLWREAHPGIVQQWYDLEDAAKYAIKNRGKVATCGRVAFRVAGSFLFMRLPSGRCIAYPYPCIKDKAVPWGGTRAQVSYKGVDTYTRQWTDCFAHGGLLFNNVVQGIARDIEADAMIRVEAARYPIILTVHDEVVCETRSAFGNVAEFEKLMTTLDPVYEGLPVAAGAWSAERYKK